MNDIDEGFVDKTAQTGITRRTETTLCRVCHAQCPMQVEFEGDQAVKAYGHKGNPVSKGFYCSKGKNIHRYPTLPSRLLHSVKRVDGGFVDIASSVATQEIAAKLNDIIARHGPRSVAMYGGIFGYLDGMSNGFCRFFMEAIESKMLFTSLTIDQPGKFVAAALHGTWGAHWIPEMEGIDAVLLIGHNPIVSMGAAFGHAAAHNIAQARRRGMKLIVIDPRHCESAQQADVFLQCLPGQDPAILAGMIRIILDEKLEDAEFIAGDVNGIDALRASVAPFTPQVVAACAGISVESLVLAARTYAAARRATVAISTGPNMAARGNLTEYLGLCLATICGHRPRAGEPVLNPGVLIHPPQPPMAASHGPQPAWDLGEKLRVHGLTNSAAGMPTAALADEILTPGEGKVRALLVVGGNPMLAFPDQHKTLRALQDLELLICIDPQISATAELAHYVLAPKLMLEMPANTFLSESLGHLGSYWGYDKPYAQYTPALADPPPGSDVKSDWEYLFDITKHMGRTITVQPNSFSMNPAAGQQYAQTLDMNRRYTSDEMLEILYAGSPVPHAEVVATAREGRVFDRGDVRVQPKPPAWTGRLDVGNVVMMAELGAVVTEPPAVSEAYPLLLISRRMRDVYNTSWHDFSELRQKYTTNPAFINPDDAAALGLKSGDIVTITSDAGEIPGVIEIAPDVRRGVVSMSHGWGVSPGQSEDPRNKGGCTSRLVSTDRDCDPYTGMARQSAIPVRLTFAPSANATA